MPALTKNQIETFQQDGVLVVENILNSDQLQAAREGLHETLLTYNVDPNNLRDTAQHLGAIGSMNGSGGILDIFYANFKFDIACNETLFQVTKELWEAGYCHKGESEEETISMGRHEIYHPFGPFDLNKGYVYIDRLGYRIPTAIAEEVGAKLHEENEKQDITKKMKKSKRKNTAIQRSLTPHFDCCPNTFGSSDKPKWRPIQCFVSLTDNLEANTGGFEAAPGFHRKFNQWAKDRQPTTITKKDKRSGAKSKVDVPAPCVGEYTHVRPNEDSDVMKAVKHIPVPAGSAVFWDNRIPHANSYKNDTNVARAVVYCSFLPDVRINRLYAEKQLADYQKGRLPRDVWIDVNNEEDADKEECDVGAKYEFSDLGKKLMKIENW